MCKCIENNWCRTWEETHGGKYPCSEHAPGCDKYKPETFVRICYDGTCIIVEENERDFFGIYGTTFEEIQLTRDQFDKIPEFQGF